MGRNLPSIRRKIDEIVKDVNKMVKLVKDKHIKMGLENIYGIWYGESASLSVSNNPLLPFNLLLLNIAKLEADLRRIMERLDRLEKKVNQTDEQ